MNKENITYSMKQVAHILNIQFGEYKMGRNILFEYLRYFKILQEAPNKNIPFSEYYKRGYFLLIPISKYGYSGYKTEMTIKGLEAIEKEFKMMIISEEEKYLTEYYPNFKYRGNSQ